MAIVHFWKTVGTGSAPARATRLLLVTFVALAGIWGRHTKAAEFLPFPKSPERQAAAPTGDFSAQFQNSIARLSCGELKKLHEDLIQKAKQASADVDRNYYFHLLGITDKRASEIGGCQMM